MRGKKRAFPSHLDRLILVDIGNLSRDSFFGPFGNKVRQ